MNRGANRSLLVVGSVALDDIDGPYGMHTDLLGGSASFFAVAASYFTPSVSVIAVVGDDFPEEHLDFFRSRGIDTSGISRVRGTTFHWVGRYADDLASRTSLDTRLGVFADFRPRLEGRHRAAELVCLGNIDPQLQRDVLAQAEAPKLVAADTMNFWITGRRDELIKTLRVVHTLIINDEEARLLADCHNLVTAAERIRAMGPVSLVIKRGDAGALLFSDAHPFFAPALPLEDVRDPTGAGDSFAGGFMGYLAWAGNLAPDTIRHAMIAGSVMASFCVEQFSLDGLRNLDRQRIQERIDRFAELSRYERISL
ncbi:MAG TPA: PfkB family carbohydrate kinase [Kofleriaceae bacterium]|nr:PfkB family carbohydrate kinase [Kofleriaceae bacterium]